MVVVGGIGRFFFDRLFEERDGYGEKAAVGVSPAQCIGGIGQCGEATARRLGESQCYVEVTAMLEHQIGQVVGGGGIVRLQRERLLVQDLGLLPISPGVIERAEADIKLDVAWG